MKSRIIFGLTCIAVLVFACGPRPTTGDVASTVYAVPARASSPSGPALLGSLNVKVKNGVAMDFRVVNSGAKKLELNFANGQTHDLIVLDSLGHEVWRWSKGRMFTQSLQNKVLHSRDSLDYGAEWRDAPAGTYTAVATLASANFPVEERAQFVVR